MKLRIELDLDPSEFELANELIATLRTLTEHVKVNLQGRPNGEPGRVQQPSIPPATKQPPTVAQPAAQLNSSPRLDTIPSPASRPAAPPPATRVPNGQPTPASPAAFDYKAALEAYEGALEAGNESLQLQDMEQQRLKTFLSAYTDALWRTERSYESRAVLDLCFLMPRLPASMLDSLKKTVISEAMKHLMIKRPLNTDRTAFFAQAETFAAMIKLEYVLVPGAIQTIMQLLRKPETCVAAITMLGKTVELCAEQLKEKFGDDKSLATLRAALEEVNFEEVVYDKDYIAKAMGWVTPEIGPPTVPPAAEPPRPAPSSSPPPAVGSRPQSAAGNGPSPSLPRLEPISIWEGYGAPVRALALDEERQQVVSIAQDGTLSLHTFGGERLAKINVKQRVFVEMDYNPSTSVLIMAGMPSGGQAVGPCYATYRVGSARLDPLGLASPPKDTKSLNKLRFLAQGSTDFVGAEGTQDNRQIIGLYQSGSIQDSNDDVLVPIKVFQTDLTMITSISCVPSSSQAFLSAGRSGEVLVWQLTNPSKPAAILLPPPTDGGPDGGNASVITCLEVLGHLVLAGTYGQGTNVWNLRNLKNDNSIRPSASIKLDEHAVTRLARFGEPQDRTVAVAASKSIHTIKLRDDGTLEDKMPGQKASEKFYWDAKWSSAGGPLTLFAASAASTLDVYRAV